jgi:2-(1,2-epoxy-1,2-dihydrophenyl)acetyl-CoA isomerase
MSEQPELIVTERHGSVTMIALNRPNALNAFNRELALNLDASLRAVERDISVRAVIITGQGRAFSAGQDIRELAQETAEQGPQAVGDQLRNRFNPIVLRIREMEKPVIAAINGVTTGAGLGIALAADYRIAADTATFGISPMGIGLIPGAGGSVLLPALIGLGRASELALLGQRIPAERALDVGLVNQVVPEDRLFQNAMAVAEQLAELPTKTIGLTKRAFNRAVLPNLAEHLAYEAALQEIAAATADHSEGLAAMLEKRSPTFSGN